MLDFDPENALEMHYCLSDNEELINRIPFPHISSVYYTRLKPFEYIGIKYFNYIKQDSDIEFM
jgi:hypothetical protein